MHSNLHKKAFKQALLICNGHETYHDDIVDIFDSLYTIDPYYQKQDHLESLEIFKEYLEKNNINKNSTKIIYSSGLEDKKDIKEYLDKEFYICGNNFYKYTLLSNPYNLDKKLFQENIVLPNISRTFHYKYISKKINSSGGLNIANNHISNDIYYQQYIPGNTYSVSFLATEINSKILGFNQLFLVKDNAKYPYLYAGAMTLDLDHEELNYYTKWINNFSSLYKLNGFCSIDYKIYDNKIYILDINPRLSGTYRLYKKKYKNLMHHHIGLVSEELTSVSSKYYAYIILFAKNDYVADRLIYNIQDISDVPILGETIKKNMPILTLNFRSNDKSKIKIKIKDRIKSAMEIIDCYNTELEYE